MNLEEYLKLQEEEFLDFGNNPDKKVLLAAKTFDIIQNFYNSIGGVVKEYENKNAYLVTLKNDIYHLFIEASEDEYRDLFKNFLWDKYGVPHDQVPSEMNVDHVFNKARGKGYYIRMILLEEDPNKEWGRSYERTMTNIEKKRGGPRNTEIYLDFSIFLKILKLPSFKKGSIKKEEYIEQIAEAATDELQKIFPNSTIDIEIVKRFYRAENNLIKYGKWKDPLARQSKSEIKKANRSDFFNFPPLIDTIKEIAENIITDKSFEYDGFHKCSVTNAKCKVDGKDKSTDINDVCENLLSNLDKAKDVEVKNMFSNNGITKIKITASEEKYNDKYQRVDMLVRTYEFLCTVLK